MQGYTLKSNQRENLGKEKCKKIRAAGSVPAVLYGAECEPVNLVLNSHDLGKLLVSIRGKFAMIDLEVAENPALNSKIMFREVQRDPVSHEILHVDLYRLSEKKEIKLSVPVHFEGTAKGVKLGGIFEALNRSIEIKAIPSKIPAFVKVDINELDMGDGIFVRDLNLGEGVTILDEEDMPLAHVAIPKATKEGEETGAAATAEPSKEPELIKKEKKTEEEK